MSSSPVSDQSPSVSRTLFSSSPENVSPIRRMVLTSSPSSPKVAAKQTFSSALFPLSPNPQTPSRRFGVLSFDDILEESQSVTMHVSEEKTFCRSDSPPTFSKRPLASSQQQHAKKYAKKTRE